MGGEGGDAEAGQPVAPATLEDEVADERNGPDRGDLQRRCAPSLLEHLARGQRRVTLADQAMMISGVAHAVVQNISLESLLARARRKLDRFVNVSAFPT